MLLADKVAAVYGAGGSVGRAVSRAFASDGARVFLAGRSAAAVTAVADEINAEGGNADAASVDALRFRNTATSDADNTCPVCPIPLGVGAGGTASNGMELRFQIEGHRAGIEYDILRTRLPLATGRRSVGSVGIQPHGYQR